MKRDGGLRILTNPVLPLHFSVLGLQQEVRRLDGDNGSPGPARPGPTSGIRVEDWLG